jgi:anti-sigma factor RsiW
LEPTHTGERDEDLIRRSAAGDAAAGERAQVEEHLRGCDRCTRFGGELRATVTALRTTLLRGPPAPPRVQERLREAIRRDPAKG